MNQNDIYRFARNEEKMRAKLLDNGISALPDMKLPYESWKELMFSVQHGAVQLVVPYNSELIDALGTTKEQRATSFFSFVVMGTIVGFIGLAIYAHTWVYVLSATFAFVSMFLSSPFNRWRNTIGSLLFIAFLGAALAGNWRWASVPAAYCWVTFCTQFIRVIYQRAIEARVARSETFFCWLYLNQAVAIHDKASGITVRASDWEKLR